MHYDIRESYRATVSVNGVVTVTDYDTEDLLKCDLNLNKEIYPDGVPVVVDKIVKSYSRYGVYHIPGGQEIPPLTIEGGVPCIRKSYTKTRVSVDYSGGGHA